MAEPAEGRRRPGRSGLAGWLPAGENAVCRLSVPGRTAFPDRLIGMVNPVEGVNPAGRSAALPRPKFLLLFG